MKVGSLFSGIGGFDLALRNEGMSIRWQVEIDPYARGILRRQFPEAQLFGDIRKVRGTEVEPVELLCGGFPCQDISVAGRGEGIDGEQSGLWREFARLIREVRPRWVIIENSPALRTRGLSRVLRDLHASGFDAEWDGLPASAFGAPHERDRIWVVAYPHGDFVRQQPERNQREGGREGAAFGRDFVPVHPRSPRVASDADGEGELQPRGRIFPLGERVCDGAGWCAEPDVARVVHGVPNGVDRIRCLGNAIVPAVAASIARRIVQWEAR